MPHIHVERLKQLPQRSDQTWQGGVIPARTLDEDKATSDDANIAIWINPEAGQVYTGTVATEQRGEGATVFDALVNFACDPEAAGYRPGRVIVTGGDLAKYLDRYLRDAQIEVVQTDELKLAESLSTLIGDLTLDELISTVERLDDDLMPIPALISGRGVNDPRQRVEDDMDPAFYPAPSKHEPFHGLNLVKPDDPPPIKPFRFRHDH